MKQENEKFEERQERVIENLMLLLKQKDDEIEKLKEESSLLSRVIELEKKVEALGSWV